ncbi:hypothetical protein [Herbidospora cretacea]|uniref:hypothetical protein n=1 Tax=Herbidospora cretacea TaxID=28444 RepID=UPI000773814B|nr:hypothetical protein [Herbidospora cretacea]
MRPFLHDRLRRQESLLASSTEAMRAFTTLDLALDQVVVAFLDEAGAVYAAIGAPEAENETLSLKAQFTSARSGVNPLTLERVTQRRREMERTIALHALTVSADRLRTGCAEARATLAAAREQLVPLVAYGFQKGLVPDGELGQAELERVWRTLSEDPQIRPVARQIALSLHPADILLLLGDLL